MFGRSPVYAQRPEWVAALEAAHLGSGYYPTPGGYIGSRRLCPDGIGGDECQPDGDGCSLHNYGIAWDVEYNYNPHFDRPLNEQQLDELYLAGRTKYCSAIVRQIENVRNTHGQRLFRWLGWSIGDTMHWEIDVPPNASEVDWSTIPEDGVAPPTPPTTGDEVYLPLTHGMGFNSNPARREDVKFLQFALERAGFDIGQYGPDGKYGDDTASAVAQLPGGGDGRIVDAQLFDEVLKHAYGSGESALNVEYVQVVRSVST